MAPSPPAGPRSVCEAPGTSTLRSCRPPSAPGPGVLPVEEGLAGELLHRPQARPPSRFTIASCRRGGNRVTTLTRCPPGGRPRPRRSRVLGLDRAPRATAPPPASAPWAEAVLLLRLVVGVLFDEVHLGHELPQELPRHHTHVALEPLRDLVDTSRSMNRGSPRVPAPTGRWSERAPAASGPRGAGRVEGHELELRLAQARKLALTARN